MEPLVSINKNFVQYITLQLIYQ